MITVEVIEEEAVTTGTLLAIFQQAFLKTMITDNEEIVVLTDGPQVLFGIVPAVKTIRYTIFLDVDPSAQRQDLVELANLMNDQTILTRFSVPANKPYMIASYYLSYENGIAPYQIISTLRLMLRTVHFAIANFDTSKIIRLDA